MKRLLSLLDTFAEDHWRLYGCIRMLLLIFAAICLVVGLDKLTMWLMK